MRHGLILPGSAANRSAPLNLGLVYWGMVLPNRMGGRGSTLRDIWTTKHGTITGATWNGQRGPLFGSLAFTSTNKVTLADSILPYSTVTVLMWVNVAGNTGLMSIGSDDVTGASHGMDIAAGKIRVYQRDVYASGATTVATGSWQHLGFSTAPSVSTSNFWLNGLSDGTFTGRGSVYSTKNYVGYWPFASTSDKKIADVRIYNRKLSAAEVMAVYQASSLGYPNELNWLSRPVVAEQAGEAATTFKYVIGAGCGGHIISSGI